MDDIVEQVVEVLGVSSEDVSSELDHLWLFGPSTISCSPEDAPIACMFDNTSNKGRAGTFATLLIMLPAEVQGASTKEATGNKYNRGEVQGRSCVVVGDH
jgi:hypothetical protein